MNKALEDSIQHWAQNLKLAKKGELIRNDIRGSACALCDAYYDDGNCTDCPLYVNLEIRWGSLGSPWQNVCNDIIYGGDREESTRLMLKILKACRKPNTFFSKRLLRKVRKTFSGV